MTSKEELLRLVTMAHDAITKERPFTGETLTLIKNFYKIPTTYSSNALEGNTLTEGETKIIIEDGITVGGKSIREINEAIGHADAYDYIWSIIYKDEITQEDIKEIHRLFYRGIEEDKAGVYRTDEAFVTGSKYPLSEPKEIDNDMYDLECWMRTERRNHHPVEYAAELHRRFVYIHPFSDGNGRTARLLMNAALIRDGYLPNVISPVLRLEYIMTLEEAHEEAGKDAFTIFIAETEKQTQKDFMRLLHIKEPSLETIQLQEDINY